jgi:hypothetical protein
MPTADILSIATAVADHPIVTSIDCEVLGAGEYTGRLELTLTEAGKACHDATEAHSSERGTTTFDRWHCRTLVWSQTLSQGAAVVADEDKLDELAAQLAPLVARVSAGHDTEWDGSNYVGVLDDDAQEASDEIEEIIEAADWTSDALTARDAGDWTRECRKDGVTAETTTPSSRRWPRDDDAIARAYGVVLSGSTLKVRTEARDEMRAERDDEDDD